MNESVNTSQKKVLALIALRLPLDLSIQTTGSRREGKSGGGQGDM